MSLRAISFVLIGVGLAVASGCGTDMVTRGQNASDFDLEIPPLPTTSTSVLVPARAGWVDSGIDVQIGEPLLIRAHGTVQYRKKTLKHSVAEITVGPEGTYLHDDEAIDERFPLAAAASGPAPCYGLIGRIDGDAPFVIGREKSFTPPGGGRLLLAINDPHPQDNSGAWTVDIERSGIEVPVANLEVLSGAEPPGIPLPGCKVVVFYVDGLRPDVVSEMAALGHLPNIRRHFLDGGTWVKECYTGFPSDTITSNGSMWTGCFSDRHGIKGQVRFSRRTLHSDSYLEPLGPQRVSSTLTPVGLDRISHKTKAHAVGTAKGDAAEARYDQSRVTGVAPIYAHLQHGGRDWATGILPMMTETPPLLWTRSLVRYLPFFQSQRAWEYIDDANTHFALKQLLSREEPVTIIWLPETDSVSHKKRRGQFGLTRRTIARADILIGQVIEEVVRRGEAERTYFMIVSDHGHHGGRQSHLAHYDLAHRVFYEPRYVDGSGAWVGGGLGMSVRQHRSWSRHPEHKSREFVYLDANSDGAARIFLPRGHFRSGVWQGGANRPGDLLAYQVDPTRPPVNLLEQLVTRTAAHPDGHIEPPVDLVLMKLNQRSMLIATGDRNGAVVERRRGPTGRWEYRYSVVRNLAPAPDGGVHLDVIALPDVDPLGLTDVVDATWLAEFHSEREWIDVTSRTAYPDAVVTLSRHMLWEDRLAAREAEYAPDLVVTARPGWFFGVQGSKGTMHGYPLRDSMRASWFMTGPNIRRGAVLHSPRRLVDLTPTILEMSGHPAAPHMVDGSPLRCVYDTGCGSNIAPVFWSDVDLHAWTPLHYRAVADYPHLPHTVNRPEKWLDLNNIVYNALTIPDLPLARLADSVLLPFWDGDGPLLMGVERLDFASRRASWNWWAEGADALDVTGVALGDYTITSLGNLKRIDGGIDWAQARTDEAGRLLVSPFGGDHLPGIPTLNRGIDAVQHSAWDAYRFGQRIVVQVADETILNGFENAADKGVNSHRKIPAELRVGP